MDLYEYQGKDLFRRVGIPVSAGPLATTPEEARSAAEELGGPVVVKAQVLTGGRGKAGGVKLADDPADAEAKARDILGLDIRGHVVRTVWVEKASDIAREYYLSFTFDHRIVDGAVGATFGNAVIRHLQNPASLLLPDRLGS